MPSSDQQKMGNPIHRQDLSKKSFRIKQDDKFFSRLLSKEASQPNSSCRIYYGEAAGAIPFVWESQPGTPKYTLFENASLPPLTPPPSYVSSTPTSKSMHRSPKSSKPKLLLLTTLFPGKDQKARRKLSQPSSLSSLSSTSSTTSSSSSWSNFSASKVDKRRPLFLADSGSSVGPFDFPAEYDDHDDEVAFRSPTSILCFPVKKKTWDFLAGCYQMGSNVRIGRRVL